MAHPHTSGTPGGYVDIGPVGSIGPHGVNRGRVVGAGAWKALGGLLVGGAMYHYHNRARDYNDRPANAPVRGSIGGVTVKPPLPGEPGGPRPTATPSPRGGKAPPRVKMPGWYEGSGWDRWDQPREQEDEPMFDPTEEEIKAATARNKNIAKQKAPPTKKKHGPLDTSDLHGGPTA
jgi:hypothetical protein